MRGKYYIVARIMEYGKIAGYAINTVNSEEGAQITPVRDVYNLTRDKQIINAKMMNGFITGIGCKLGDLKTYGEDHKLEVSKSLWD